MTSSRRRDDEQKGGQFAGRNAAFDHVCFVSGIILPFTHGWEGKVSSQLMLRTLPLLAALLLLRAPSHVSAALVTATPTSVPPATSENASTAFFDGGFESRIGLLCHNDPVNKSDPMGLDTAVAIGGPRWDSWGDSPNPLGHSSLALTGQGTFSFGTGTSPGSNFTNFVGDQSAHRWTAVYILKTTPAQEAAMKRNLEASREKGQLPNIFKDTAGAYKDNCATRTADALREGGQNIGHPKTPGALQHKLV